MSHLSPTAGTILVVEDDHDIRSSLAELLRMEGYRVDAVANGEEALRHLSHHPKPCLILLDLMMPVMNGWEFRAEQVTRAEWANIPVVVVSGGHDVPSSARQLQASDFMEKPIHVPSLLKTVGRFCVPA